MNEPDEETKEQPVFPEPAPPAEPVQPTTTIDSTPPTPPGMIPPAPGMIPPQPPYQPPQPTYPQPPAAGWQPGPQGYPPQPQGQWQTPGYGAPQGYGPPPGYGAAPGWAAPQQWAGPRYGSSVLAVLAGVVMIVFGLALAVLGGWLFFDDHALRAFALEYRGRISLMGGKPLDLDSLLTFASVMRPALLVLGLLELLVGALVLAHRGWARWLGVLLALIGLLAGVTAVSISLVVAPGASVQLVAAAVLLLGYAFVLLALIAGGSHFRQNAPRR